MANVLANKKQLLYLSQSRALTVQSSSIGHWKPQLMNIDEKKKDICHIFNLAKFMMILANEGGVDF